MKSFKQYILEGGNLMLGDQGADRIDLTKINRDSVTVQIDRTLDAINKAYKKKYGLPLWSGELFKSKEFLSGSAFHFFNRAIPTAEFTKYKNTVGDVDTQVDKIQDENLGEFLKAITGKTFGDASLIGFKKSAGQYITLWAFPEFGINIQVDMELVDFAYGKPTAWSMFSHSSAWNDITAGIKGVFHKYIMRAASAKTLRDIIILKGKKETPTKIKASDLAFSVQHGLRTKIAPVLDGVGKHIMQDGLYVYREIPTSESTYITDLKVIFKLLFERMPSAADMKMMDSFIGAAELIKKYIAPAEQTRLINAFANILFDKGAQGLYRGDAERDNAEKMAAFLKLTEIIGAPYDRAAIDDMRAEYYKGYK
jgi:hypothetical protein